MKKAKILLAGIVLMLLSVSASAQLPTYQGCDSPTRVTVDWRINYNWFPSYVSVKVEWTFVQDPSWTVSHVQTIYLTYAQSFNMGFSIPVCENEIASIKVELWRGDLLGIGTTPILLKTVYHSGYTDDMGIGF
jgi:hypothetical protein